MSTYVEVHYQYNSGYVVMLRLIVSTTEGGCTVMERHIISKCEVHNKRGTHGFP